MLVGDLDEVTYDLEVDGEEVRRTLQRRVWEKRGWATVAIVFEERGRDGAWKAPKLALIRLQRMRGAWKKSAAITLAGPDALALVDALGGWKADLVGSGDESGDEAEADAKAETDE